MSIRIRVYPQHGSVGYRIRRNRRIEVQQQREHMRAMRMQQALIRQQQLQSSMVGSYGSSLGYGIGLGLGLGSPYGSYLPGSWSSSFGPGQYSVSQQFGYGSLPFVGQFGYGAAASPLYGANLLTSAYSRC